MTTTPKTFAPFLFLRRGRVWTIVYPDASGKKTQKATKFRGPEDEPKAKRALALFTERLKASRLVEGQGEEGPMTVARWAVEWLRTREVKGIATVDDYRSRLEHHVLPVIGDKRIDKVTTDDVTRVVHEVARKGLAPRTQRHVYDAMRAMFGRAVPRLIEINPCSLHPEDLPRKKDQDPEWRPTAIFEREEVVRLLSAPAIPADRHAYYAVMFLAGLRFGEVAALKVRHYRPEMQPLAQLQVGRSYNSKKRAVKGVKTERPRLVPVHAWLRSILDRWLAVEFAEMMGRPPLPDDVLIPTRRGTHRNCSTGWVQFNDDLARLGMRARRQHDARRTFITLARADGARKDLLRLVTHGPEGDIVDIYTEMPWAALCEEVAKLRLSPPPPAPVSEPANPPESHGGGLPLGCHAKIAQRQQEVTMRPQRDSNPSDDEGQAQQNDVTDGQPARTLGFAPPDGLTNPAAEGHPRPMATVATLAIRQALAALERGRVDQATDILRRAVIEEARAGDSPPRKEASRSGGER